MYAYSHNLLKYYTVIQKKENENATDNTNNSSRSYKSIIYIFSCY